LPASNAGPQQTTTVAVTPCIRGPEVSDALADQVTDALVAGLARTPRVVVLDRSKTAALVQEQDLALLSHASAVLPGRFGDVAAERALLSRLIRLHADWFLTLMLVDVPSGRVLRTRIESSRIERDLLDNCAAWAGELWRGVSPPSGTPAALDPSLLDLFSQIDERNARQLLGRAAERAESVYRRYEQAVRDSDTNAATRLQDVARSYLLDCVELLQRVAHPPAGMVYVPPGAVVLPVPGGARKTFEVDGFFIDRTELTRADYARFLDETRHRPPLGWQPPTPNTGCLAVAGVDWHDAQAAAEWRGLRLPSWLEWVRAARAAKDWRYPWGNEWCDDCCDYAVGPGRSQAAPVGSHPKGASPFGVLDMAGGVYEWLATWHAPEYWAHAPRVSPPGPPTGAGKLIAGGSFRTGSGLCTCEQVEAAGDRTQRDDVGFRCVLPVRSEGSNGEEQFP
jgi:formylglycine-generating enzyme required for sulfatase activity